jgi:hypothetical protein
LILSPSPHRHVDCRDQKRAMAYFDGDRTLLARTLRAVAPNLRFVPAVSR